MLKDIDNLVLVTLLAWSGKIESQQKFSEDLQVSAAGLSRSLKRLTQARFIRRGSLEVSRSALEEYLLFGMKYVFPASLGTRVRGVPTAYSAPPYNMEFASEESCVWAAEFGRSSGLQILPLHPSVPSLCVAHPELYPVFAGLDVLRIGRAKEQQMARDWLKRWIQDA